MQPLFTIHAGEYLVGSHIEQHLRDPNGDNVNVWVPSKDTGVDVLVTDKTNKKTTSLQVKLAIFNPVVCATAMRAVQR